MKVITIELGLKKNFHINFINLDMKNAIIKWFPCKFYKQILAEFKILYLNMNKI